ncbi:MAG: transposase [Candidatus Saccharibacteria bacterium]|nr:transposase [Candidatus Saccharibacteria bacterium]MCY4088653.1 transposase [Candidatus Saccharibacteria bacterium]
MPSSRPQKKESAKSFSQPVNFKGIYKLRSLVETVFSVLKESFNLLTFRARSLKGYLLHYTLALLSYQYKKIYD